MRRWVGPSAPWPVTAEGFWRFISGRENRTYALIDSDDALAGIGQVRTHNPTRGHLARLIIDPQRRGRGLGRILSQSLMTEASRITTVREFSLYVFPDNTNAIALYQSLGFVAQGPEHDKMGCTLMLAPLSVAPAAGAA